ncbi:c-type cytochrome [Muricauda sp. CAU 1633]|uniref:c-type cytochrome n=1 Tax=Allomuricauda sp. CAU 1633 TaxID=2816036 RepID=UPI001A8F4B6B|nr:c-type cytochrome [Muricauda sp. CAU 1633]MBO0322937.1 c-type cytochrome [Muricauda sp. CAU 1633]
MKNLKKIIIGFILILLTGTTILIWILKVNGVKIFDSEKVEYQPLVSKDAERTSEFENGLNIFLRDCGKCHVTKNKLHNYLGNVVNKMGEEYLILYLTKQDSLIENKDKLALAIKKEWGNQPNNHNFNYSKQDLKSLIEYLK